MTDEEHLLERCLDGIDTWQTSLSDYADQYEASHPDLIRDLRLAQRLRQVRVPEQETASARACVRLMLLTAIEADGAAPACDSDQEQMAERVPSSKPGRGEAPLRFPAPRRPLRRPAALVAAVMLLFAVLGAWAASSASTGALPGSPLYGVKRLEEGLALMTAWSHERQSDVLLMMAGRRLVEVRAEALAGNTGEVHALTADLDATMQDLIQLTAIMQAHHEDTRTVVAGLARTLEAEAQALNAAQQSGQTLLIQALSTATQDQQGAILASNLTLPPISAAPSTAGTSSNGAPPGAFTTPTPVTTPSSGTGGSGPAGTHGNGGTGGGSGPGGRGGPGGSGGPSGHGHGPSVGSVGSVGGSGGAATTGGTGGTGGSPSGGGSIGTLPPLGGWHRRCQIDC